VGCDHDFKTTVVRPLLFRKTVVCPLLFLYYSSEKSRGVNLPSTEVLIKLAEVFNVTLDYLAFEAKGQPASLNIQDRELLRRFEEVDTLTDQEKNLAKEILDLVILKHRFRELTGPKAAIG